LRSLIGEWDPHRENDMFSKVRNDAIIHHGAGSVSAARGAMRGVGACAALLVLIAAFAQPAAAGNAAVSYENQIKVEQRKEREKQAASGQPAAAPAAVAPARPAAAAPAVAQGDRDHVFAATTRGRLSDVVEMADAEIANGTDPQLKAAATRMADALRKEIAELDKWLAAHPQPASTK
jgi:hypothetical protein